ncbi:MAG: hypothetical protein IJF02_03765 [Oscillospiraceae bacterium]|nr:hypothetical protein [Oscillospiraceae bacterium]
MKKLFALLLAVVLVLGLVACAQPVNPTEPNNDPTTTGKPTTAAPTTTTEPGVKVEFPLAEEITIKYLVPMSTIYKDFKKTLEANKLWQKLYEMTNIKVELVQCDDLDTLNAYIQQGSYGDIIACNGVKNASTEASINQLIASKALLDVNEYANNPNVMPNLHKYVLAELPEVKGKWMSPDGGLYVFGFYSAEKWKYLESSCWINKTWLEKANMTVADVATFEGLEKFFAWIMANDPNGNGKQDEVPYFCYASGGNMIEALLGSFGMPTKDATNENYITIEDGEVLFVPQQTAYKDFLTMMNKWYTNGWMYKDYFLGHSATLEAAARDLLWNNNGEPDRIAFYTATSQPARVTSSGENDMHPNKDNKCEYISILPPKAEGYTTEWYMHPGFMGSQGALMVSAKTQYPAEVCAWIDLFYNEDITVDAINGSEGSAWRVVDKDGKISRLSGITAEVEEELRNVKLDLPLRTMITSLPYATTANALENKLTLTDAVIASKNALKFYEDAGVLNDASEVWPRPYMSTENSEEIGEIRGDIMLLVETYRAESITGKKNFTSDWDALQKALKNDVKTERFVEILQETFDVCMEGSGK